MRNALLVIAHGSRQEEANADLHDLVAALRRGGRFAVVEPSFLELAEPGIDAAAARCVGQGAEAVVLLPYFLSAGVHVRRDLAAARERLAERYPRVRFRLAEPLGPHPLLLEIVTQRAHEAADGIGEQGGEGGLGSPRPSAERSGERPAPAGGAGEGGGLGEQQRAGFGRQGR